MGDGSSTRTAPGKYTTPQTAVFLQLSLLDCLVAPEMTAPNKLGQAERLFIMEAHDEVLAAHMMKDGNSGNLTDSMAPDCPFCTWRYGIDCSWLYGI